MIEGKDIKENANNSLNALFCFYATRNLLNKSIIKGNERRGMNFSVEISQTKKMLDLILKKF
jgi:hypothetical protein